MSLVVEDCPYFKEVNCDCKAIWYKRGSGGYSNCSLILDAELCPEGWR
ncbi:unnamed protein product [marine sediment metagenome]|uniref:Uncharacterized protein n=1 Tax=marine sediment metagenome TaxID=412755 RepID=X0ZPS3_9ZZZZ